MPGAQAREKEDRKVEASGERDANFKTNYAFMNSKGHVSGNQ